MKWAHNTAFLWRADNIHFVIIIIIIIIITTTTIIKYLGPCRSPGGAPCDWRSVRIPMLYLAFFLRIKVQFCVLLYSLCQCCEAIGGQWVETEIWCQTGELVVPRPFTYFSFNHCECHLCSTHILLRRGGRSYVIVAVCLSFILSVCK